MLHTRHSVRLATSRRLCASTAQIMEGSACCREMREMQDKLDALREKNAQQAVILNNTPSRLLSSRLCLHLSPKTFKAFKCKLPKTEVINVQPDYILVNRSIPCWPYGPYYGCGCGFGAGFGLTVGTAVAEAHSIGVNLIKERRDLCFYHLISM